MTKQDIRKKVRELRQKEEEERDDGSENKIVLRDKIKTEVAISLKSDEIIYARLSMNQKFELLNIYEDLSDFVDKYREYVLLYYGDKEYCDSPFTFVEMIFDVE
ncbi:MAG TPA: hypothetical protein VEF53_09415 [Patescibacteria group bacterium]|nr:hypothetical protein [Patescibacteria group bacterium]